MQFNYLSQALEHLGKTHFQKSWPLESIKVMANETADIEDNAMVQAIRRIRMEISPATFPPLKRVSDILKEEQVKINVSKSPEEPRSRQYNDAHPIIDVKKINEMGAQSLILIERLFDGKLTKEGLLDAMTKIMDKQYPGAGWGSEAAKLAGFYSRQERELEHGEKISKTGSVLSLVRKMAV